VDIIRDIMGIIRIIIRTITTGTGIHTILIMDIIVDTTEGTGITIMDCIGDGIKMATGVMDEDKVIKELKGVSLMKPLSCNCHGVVRDKTVNGLYIEIGRFTKTPLNPPFN
jgi:hypothetical protein